MTIFQLPELASATTVSRASNLSKQLVEELKPSILRKYVGAFLN